MTGNTVLFGIALAQGDWSSMLRSLIAMVGFSLGVIVGALLVRFNANRRKQVWMPEVTQALLVEACILLVFALGWTLARPIVAGSPIANLLIGVSALAMGQQSIAVLNLGLPGITTTYITGTITTLMANIGRFFSLPLSNQPTITPAIESQIEHEKPARLASVWLTYIIAAIIGGYGELHFAALAAFLPLLAVTVVIVLHYAPFSTKDDAHPG